MNILETIKQFFSRLRKRNHRNPRIRVYKVATRMKWKHFSEEEVNGLLDDIVFKLDRARELYGHPIIITSGKRTIAENLKAGGVSNSAHLTGKAADIRVPDDQALREKLAWALGRAGFSRLGLYTAHAHVDIDIIDKPCPAYWTGISH